MVYSLELGYDPDEWEQCPAPEHFLVMSMFTRVCLSIGTVMASALFFWILEVNKRKHRSSDEKPPSPKESKTAQTKAADGPSSSATTAHWWAEQEEESVDTKFARAAEEAALKARPERRRNSKRELSREEEVEMVAWKAQVQRVAETRLRASQEPTSSDSEEQTHGVSEPQQHLGEQHGDGMAPAKVWQQIGYEGEEVEQRRQQIGHEAMEVEQIGQVGEEVEQRRQQIGQVGEEVEQRRQQQQSAEQQQQLLRKQPQLQIKEHSVQKVPEARSTELRVPISEWARTKQLIRVVQQSDGRPLPHAHPGATPPSTPPGGIVQPELAAHYRQMADELTRKLTKELDEMDELEKMDSSQMAEQLQRRHRQDIEGGLEGTVASTEVRHRLARQLESHVAKVVELEMRKRASFGTLAKEEEEKADEPIAEAAAAVDDHKTAAGDEQRRQQQQKQQQLYLLKTGTSSGESSGEDDFVKVERQQQAQPTLEQTDDDDPCCTAAGTALRTLMRVNAAMAGGQNGLTPSPDIGGPATEEQEEHVRVSMFEGDGGSTTADEIEYVPVLLEPSKSPDESRPKHRPLGAEEAEQMIALLQEYDLSAGEVAVTDPMLAPTDDTVAQQQRLGRQVSSGAVSSAGGVISLPDSTQRTTPAGGGSVPESPDSAVFGFVNVFPSSAAGAESGAAATEVNVSKEMPRGGEMAKALDPQQMDQHQPQQTTTTVAGQPAEVDQQQRHHPGALKQRSKDGSVQCSSFVVEEEMLESVAEGAPAAQKGEKDGGRRAASAERRRSQGDFDATGEAVAAAQPLLEHQQQMLLKSPEAVEGASSAALATSCQIGTNEAFDGPADAALLFEDVDDKDVTYAPEIQSLEVPPDQLSQSDSLNFLVDEEQFSEEQQNIAVTDTVPSVQQRHEVEEGQQQHQAEEEVAGRGAPQAEEAPPRELTPHEEQCLQRAIDRLRRTPSPRASHRNSQTQVPQAPQFLRSYFNDESTSSLSSTFQSIRQSSLLSALGVTSTQEMLLRLTSLEALSDAMRKAGLESSNLIFGIDYTASNKYQGERSFGGQSLHSINPQGDNPYQTVIKIMGRTLAPFAGREYGIPVFGFGDSTTGDWTVFSLNEENDCENLEQILSAYNRMTPKIDLSGPTNFAPLIYRAMEICQRRRDYHILVIIADGQVTNEKATVKAIVSACQYPLSIIVVGVGDGPWEMMRIFDESLPKRPWDNFHFVELHELIGQRIDQSIESRELAFAVHSLLEIPDQYATIRKMGLLSSTTYFTRPPSHSPRRSKSPKVPLGICTKAEDGSAQKIKEEKETKC